MSSEYKTYEIKAYLKKHLSKKRYKHSIMVSRTAEALADKYNVSRAIVRYAALAHDIAKEMTDEEALEYIKSYNIKLDESILENPNLAHGEIGAILLMEKFDCTNEDVLDAVRWHTYGNEVMSIIAKIVYVADIIEPTRDFDGVEELRELAFIDLDRAIIRYYEMSMEYLNSNKKKIHQNTFDMINQIDKK